MTLTMKNITKAAAATVVGFTAYTTDLPSTIDNFANGNFSIVASEAHARPGTNNQNPNNTTSNSSPKTTVSSNKGGASGTGNCSSGCTPKTPEKPSDGGDGDTPGKCEFTASGVSFNANTITARYDSDIKGDNSYFVLKGKLRAPKDTSTIKSRILSKKLRDADAPFTSTIAQCIQTACEAEAANHNRRIGGNKITKAGGVNFVCHSTVAKSSKTQITRSKAQPAKLGGVYVAPKRPDVVMTSNPGATCEGAQDRFKTFEKDVKGKNALHRGQDYSNIFTPAEITAHNSCEQEGVVKLKTAEGCTFEKGNLTDMIAYANGKMACPAPVTTEAETKVKEKVEASVAVAPVAPAVEPVKPVTQAENDATCSPVYAEQGDQFIYDDQTVTFNEGDVKIVECGNLKFNAKQGSISWAFIQHAHASNDKAAITARFTRVMPKENLKVCATSAPKLNMCPIN